MRAFLPQLCWILVYEKLCKLGPCCLLCSKASVAKLAGLILTSISLSQRREWVTAGKVLRAACSVAKLAGLVLTSISLSQQRAFRAAGSVAKLAGLVQTFVSSFQRSKLVTDIG